MKPRRPGDTLKKCELLHVFSVETGAVAMAVDNIYMNLFPVEMTVESAVPNAKKISQFTPKNSKLKANTS